MGSEMCIRDRAATIDFNTKIKLYELNDFYQQHIADLGSAKRYVHRAAQRAKANVNWVHKNYKIIVDWLHNRNPDDMETTTVAEKTRSGGSKLKCEL